MRWSLLAGAAFAAGTLAARAVEPVPTPPRPGPPGGSDSREQVTVGTPPPSPVRPDVRTVAGKITAVDPARRELTLAAADGPLRVAIDRNTMVFLESRLGSSRDLAVGVPARVSVSGPANLAAFVELRPKGLAPSAGAVTDPAAGGEPGPAAGGEPGPSAPSGRGGG